MTKQISTLANQLQRRLPEGLLVDAAWLSEQGYSTSLRSQYVSAGWLKQPARRVYQRPRGDLTWEQVMISLQTLLKNDLAVGGRTALEMQGLVHYLTQRTTSVFIYGPKAPPTWLATLPDSVTYFYRNDSRLFSKFRVTTSPYSIDRVVDARAPLPGGMTVMPWGSWKWPLVISSPERAVLELLDELPDKESFHNVDMLLQGFGTLSPTRMQTLLVDCHSVKVKRLFFFFAERHRHAWLKHLDRKKIDFGRGKRMLVKGGRYDPRHMITVPGDLDGVQ